MASRLWQAVTPEPHEVVLEQAVPRAGNVAADRVHRFVLAAEAVGRAGVEHELVRALDVGAHLFIGQRRDQRFAQ
jgi:hypothetical protein